MSAKADKPQPRSTPLVMADDLTGACDAGAEFAATGWIPSVLLRGHKPAGSLRVFNTQSRHLSPAKAGEKIKRILAGSTASVVFKKIDTALRGHLGAEIGAALDALPDSIALVAPAIPGVGRYTRRGCQWTGSSPIGEAFAGDLASGVEESSIAKVLARETRYQPELLDLGLVRGGELRRHISDAVARGRRIMVADAERESDLAVIAGTALCQERPLVLVGSTGLARATVRRLVGARCRAKAKWPCAGPALVVAGSANPASRRQVDVAAGAGAARRILIWQVPPPRLLVQEAARAIARGRNIILEPPPLTSSPTLSARRQMERALAGAALAITGAARPARLVLVGGEAAYRVLVYAGANYLTVNGEWVPLVVRSTIYGGKFSGLPVLTKGGSTGAETCLLDILVRQGADPNEAFANDGGQLRSGLCAYPS